MEQTMVRLNRNLNVMDTNGMILASGEKERIDRIHEGAAYVAKTKEPLWITDENIADWDGAKPGVNMPIYYKDRLIGVIGITGNPEELKRYRDTRPIDDRNDGPSGTDYFRVGMETEN